MLCTVLEVYNSRCALLFSSDDVPQVVHVLLTELPYTVISQHTRTSTITDHLQQQQ
jgi:hypothetical protein